MFEKEQIKPEDDLYKRISPINFNYDEDRVSSGVFHTSRPNLSVDWSKYRSPEEALEGYPDNYLISLKAKHPRSRDLEVNHDPIFDYPQYNDNQAHSLIEGSFKSKSTAKFLINNTSLILRPKSTNV